MDDKWTKDEEIWSSKNICNVIELVKDSLQEARKFWLYWDSEEWILHISCEFFDTNISDSLGWNNLAFLKDTLIYFVLNVLYLFKHWQQYMSLWTIIRVEWISK